MKILDIYRKFDIPPNLQEHMLRVFGAISFIENHWSGDQVDWNLVKKMALLHDLGNIIKFNMDKHPEFLGEEAANVEHWKEVQRRVIQKYGPDDEEATRKMLGEIGIDQKVIDTIFSKSFANSVGIMTSNDWHLKLLYYADLRTLPFRVGSLEERLSDVRERMPKYTTRPDFEDLVRACQQIGAQIQEHLDIPESDITDQSAKIDSELIKNLEI